MRRAATLCDLVVVSLFVNPTQFGPNEDLDRYPRDFERDMELVRQEKVAAVFAPTPELMYPQGFQTEVRVKHLATHLCGKSRPVHFAGVATVVSKLFNVVQPDVAVFGEKDFQQLAIIRRMVGRYEHPGQDCRPSHCPGSGRAGDEFAQRQPRSGQPGCGPQSVDRPAIWRERRRGKG